MWLRGNFLGIKPLTQSLRSADRHSHRRQRFTAPKAVLAGERLLKHHFHNAPLYSHFFFLLLCVFTPLDPNLQTGSELVQVTMNP